MIQTKNIVIQNFGHNAPPQTRTQCLTILRKGELQQGGHEEGQATLGVVDLPAALAEPAGLCLVGDLVQAAIFARQEDAAQVSGGHGQQVGVVRGDGVQGIWQQLHATHHAVIQPCGRGVRG